MTPYYDEDGITIYHGDCREVLAWLEADVLVTDPPYGMGFRSGMDGSFGESVIVGDDDTAARDFALEAWGERPALVFGRWSVPRPRSTRMLLVWEKGNHVGMGDLRLPWKPNTEEVYVLGDGFSGHRGSSVLRYLAVAGTVGRADQGTRTHPTEKPVDLMRDLIAKCPEGAIADPFMGSGPVAQACSDLGRRYIGVELVEDYCRVAVERLSQQTLDLHGGAA